MTQSQEWLRLAGNALLICAALICTTSVILHARVPWRRSEFGRHLMIYMGTMALTLDLSVIRIFVGDTWWFALLRLFVFAAVPLAFAQRLWLQIKAQRETNQQAAADEHDR